MNVKEHADLEGRKFRNSPEEHDLPVSKIAYLHGVSESLASRWCKQIGRKNQFELAREKNDAARAHPDFGEPGEPAPCIARFVADDVGLSEGHVMKLRREAGILRPLRKEECESERTLTQKEEEMYALCRLANGWGR